MAITVRPAAPHDAERIAILSAHLGYPASSQDIERRLNLISQDPGNLVLVAELASGLIIGWLHGYLRRILESEPSVEIAGLVVDENHRGMGAGRLLMEHVEQWARKCGCSAVTLRSNVIRAQAHEFYKGLGYSIRKSQHSFFKRL